MAGEGVMAREREMKENEWIRRWRQRGSFSWQKGVDVSKALTPPAPATLDEILESDGATYPFPPPSRTLVSLVFLTGPRRWARRSVWWGSAGSAGRWPTGV